MSSPAERYAASRRRQADSATPLGRFRGLYAFPFDEFQERACEALQEGRGVLVAAPTGSGKTVVGEFAVHLALEDGRKCFYTTPIKALSNQKYRDLVERYGPDAVGLLTGDNSINGEAPIIVMTTEVLRNMLYAGSSTLAGLGYVVMDEVHYLADRFRGAVWEEVIIHLPESVALVSLSATVSNAEEFGEWLVTVRGDTDVVVEERRPVPLWQHVMVGRRLLDLFVDETQKRVNPELLRLSRDEAQLARVGDRRPARGARRPRRRASTYTPSRVEVLHRLESAGLLPAITFIFSRAGCDAAVLQCLYAGVRLTTTEEQKEIRTYVQVRCESIPEEDLNILGYHEWLDGLERGIAAHHAGMLPTFKEVVEELFTRGLVRAVFATETLALGINMPAKSVVIEKLVKWNGETHAEVTAAEYTQLTGRAGRRGIDVEGHAVVLWQPQFDPTAMAGLASTRTYPLRSSFRPSYNMAVNLVRQVGREPSRELLESSFAQFQADRAVVGLARQIRRNEEALQGYLAAAQCHLGDFMEYAELRQRIREREQELARQGKADQRAAAVAALERLRPGDIIEVPSGRFAGYAVVLDVDVPSRDGPRPTVLTEARQVRRLSLVDFPSPVEPVGRLRIPRGFNARVPASRRDLAAALRERLPAAGPRSRRRRQPSPEAEDRLLTESSGPAPENAGPAGFSGPAPEDAGPAGLRRQLRSHPCHGCDEREDHARWAERYFRLDRETRQLQRRVDSRTNTIARQFDRVCDVLEELGYLRGDTVTSDGQRLASLYTELDLLVAEALRHGLFDLLAPDQVAAVVSALTYESRQPDDVAPPRLPAGPIRDTLAELVQLWGRLDEREKAHRLDFLREPDLGFAWAAWRWASGDSLESVLTTADLTAGDFVRAMKQLLDLLDQISDAAGDTPLRDATRKAAQALRRGVVAYSSVG